MTNKTIELLFNILTLAISTGLISAILTAIKSFRSTKRNNNLDFLIRLAFVVVNSLEQSDTIEARKARATAEINKALAKNKLTKNFPAERISQVIELVLNNKDAGAND